MSEQTVLDRLVASVRAKGTPLDGQEHPAAVLWTDPKREWQPLRDLGFDDVALLEVGHIVGIFNYLTRLADGFGLQLDRRTIEASETGVALRRPAEQTAGD